MGRPQHNGRDYLARLFDTGEVVLEAGILGDEAAAPHDGQGDVEDPPTVVEVLAQHEFGNDALKIPQRRPLGATTDAHGQKWVKKLSEACQAHARDGSGPRRARLLGVEMTADIRSTILARLPPPLSDLTIEQKTGSATKDVPLVDTAQVYRAFRSRVVDPYGVKMVVG